MRTFQSSTDIPVVISAQDPVEQDGGPDHVVLPEMPDPPAFPPSGTVATATVLTLTPIATSSADAQPQPVIASEAPPASMEAPPSPARRPPTPGKSVPTPAAVDLFSKDINSQQGRCPSSHHSSCSSAGTYGSAESLSSPDSRIS